MSKLVDMWTNEVAKLKEKARGEPSTSPMTETDHAQSGGGAEVALPAPAAFPGLGQALRIKPQPPMALCSDAALAMMECFSP